jgi:hypothetical protein
VTAWNRRTGLNLVHNAFEGTSEIAVLLDASSATLDGNTWSGDGVDVWQQRCDETTGLTESEPDFDGGWEVCPDGNVLTAYDLELTSLYLAAVETEE